MVVQYPWIHRILIPCAAPLVTSYMLERLAVESDLAGATGHQIVG
jgi:hypothetical protein